MMDGCCYHVAAELLRGGVLGTGKGATLPHSTPTVWDELERLEETAVVIPCRRALACKTLDDARKNIDIYIYIYGLHQGLQFAL